jgi:hypothetical protein
MGLMNSSSPSPVEDEEQKKLELSQAIPRQSRGVKEYSLMRVGMKEEEKGKEDRPGAS